jgi:ATP-dependent helicase HrpA
MTASPVSEAERTARLADLTIADERRLRRRLRSARKIGDAAKRALVLGEIDAQITAGADRATRRRAAVPAISFPAELPVSARVAELGRVIAEHQVVIVAGETGSGKSTQLPKLLLQLGRGVRGMIGHTQPRRIAARALAERIADETGTQVGGAIGYAIRFGDHTGPTTLVKLMTDGILLTGIGRDRMLWNYDTIIIDEAHERSLNIDFLLGYLRNLLPQRPDLKVIITSATIDPDKFSRHFGGAPVVEVSGRTYPVEIRYRPYGLDALPEVDDADWEPGRSSGGSSDSADQGQAITAAVDELLAEGDGDILVFLSGEREITDTTEVLRGHLANRRGVVEVLPLYGRLSSADQHRVFSAHVGRRIVLSTNVAETSLTVPGIRYVIDPGTARISRYSPRSKVQRLPIEPISQASAGQRAGRCGRVADGICIRLYAERDFAERPAYTDPEIARTSLASVILQMAALELGDIADFPFLDPPDRRQITDGVTVLTELGALDRTDPDRIRLTPTGRDMAGLPVDPRLARILVEGERRNCRPEMLVLVSALSVIDVREYPLEERDRATAAHSRFIDGASDFTALLSLWAYLGDQANALSGSGRTCTHS